MWFSTQDGLSRFDGAAYKNFSSSNSDKHHRITGADVYDLAFDASGDHLWVLTAYGGLSQIDVRSCYVTNTFPVIPAGLSAVPWLKCMTIKDSSICIGTNEGYFIRVNSGTGKTESSVKCPDKFGVTGSVDKIFIDKNNNTWLFISGYGILLLDKEGNRQKMRQVSKTGNADLTFYDYALYKNYVLIASSQGVLPVIVNTAETDTVTEFGKYLKRITGKGEWKAIYSLNDTITVSGSNGLYNICAAKLSYDEILLSRNYEDRDWILMTECIVKIKNSLWMGTQYGAGYIKNISVPFTAYYSSMDGSGIKMQHCNTLYSLDDSTVIVCADNGLHFVNTHNSYIKTVFKNEVFYSVFEAPYGYIIASGTTNGLQVADKNGSPVVLKNIFPELSVIKNDLLISCVKYNDSLYFLASQQEKGLYVWNTVRKTLAVINKSTSPVTLSSNIINRLYVSSKKELWIVGDNYISVYYPASGVLKTFKPTHPVNKRELSIILDICEQDDHYWLAVYGVGIVELNENLQVKRIYSEKEGLNNSGVYKIFSLNQTGIIVSSNNGLSLLNTKSGSIQNYFEDDGLQSGSFEETSGCKDHTYIFLGGINGFTRIDPGKIGTNTAPPVLYFSKVSISEIQKGISVEKDTTNLLLKTLVINSNWIQANISFAGLNYSNAQRVVYKYRVNGQDTNWINLGTQNFISLIGLNPGTYTLEVKAANEDGFWSEPKTLVLVFEPKWYQTLLFKIMVLLLIAGLFYAFYRYRIGQIKKQQLIRKSIASDLHDDIGSTLNTVKVFTHLAKRDTQKSEYLDEIENALTEATLGLRDMIWVLDDSLDTVNELLERIKKFALPVTMANGIAFRSASQVEDQGLILSKTEKRNLLLMSKEIINNSIKYAECKNIEVHFSVKKDVKKLIIKDDGKGFVYNGVSKGMGLKNLFDRAEQIQYNVEINSSPGYGTTVKIEKK